VRRTGPLLALVCVLIIAAPSVALAKHHKKLPPAVQQVINDCLDHNGRLAGHYPATLLKQALADLPTDISEYSTCANAIKRAELAEIIQSRPLPTPGKGKVSAATAKKKLKQAVTSGGEPLDLNGEKIAAGAVELHGSSLLSALPTPLLIVLLALIAIAAVPITYTVRRLVRARRTS
jgi:hypothetical protein